MNCPRHIKEKADPEASAKKVESEELEDVGFLLAGLDEEDYLS